MDEKLKKKSHDTIKVLEENIGRKTSDIPHSNTFDDVSPRAREIKERINKWDYIKLKSFCPSPWIGLENIILSEISQLVKDKYHMIPPIRGI